MQSYMEHLKYREPWLLDGESGPIADEEMVGQQSPQHLSAAEPLSVSDLEDGSHTYSSVAEAESILAESRMGLGIAALKTEIVIDLTGIASDPVTVSIETSHGQPDMPMSSDMSPASFEAEGSVDMSAIEADFAYSPVAEAEQALAGAAPAMAGMSPAGGEGMAGASGSDGE